MDQRVRSSRKFVSWLLIHTLAIIWVVTSTVPIALADDVASFWDPKRRPEKPDLRQVVQIRFLTADDFPPFNFAGPDGMPVGFNIDIARAICEELALSCTIQARRFDTLVDALTGTDGDAVIASLAVTPAMRRRLGFSESYLKMPARFVARQADMDASLPDLTGKKIAVVEGSAHAAFAADFFAKATIVPEKTAEAARAALRAGSVDLVFGDGLSLAFWLNGDASQGCCRFVGGPYLESRYFGEGMSIAVRREDATLRQAIDHALFRLWERGVYADLVRRWFPLNPFQAKP
jgi:polar amino acid transport system substrate-binding protein